jgi:citrate synthase
VRTSIAHPHPDRVEVRGLDLSSLIGSVTASEYFWILLSGARPTAVQAQMLDACIVAIAEHGLVPSVQAARMTYASGPESLHGAVAAGLLGCGSVILGSSSETAALLASVVASGGPVDKVALDAVRELREAGRTVPGVGHPLHREADPRASALLSLASRLGAAGSHVAALHAVVDAVPLVYGRSLPLNVNGVIPAVLLDVDFPVGAMKGVPLVGRTMSLVAHLLEEQEDPIGFGLAAAAEAAVEA